MRGHLHTEHPQQLRRQQRARLEQREQHLVLEGDHAGLFGRTAGEVAWPSDEEGNHRALLRNLGRFYAELSKPRRKGAKARRQ